MRVVEPDHFTNQKRQRRKKSNIKTFWLVVILAIFGTTTWYIWQKNKPVLDISATSQSQVVNKKPQVAGVQTTETFSQLKPVKVFTGEEFKNLYRSIAYPNTQKIVEPIAITGNEAADNRIRKLAEQSGYHTTSLPVQSINKVAGFNGEDDNLLQPLSNKGWLQLKTAAQKEGIPLSIISAFRSPEYQRNLFLSRLLSPTVTPELIAAGKVDPQVQETLHKTAVPGYSRHHTGYTVDLWCDDGSITFATSKCFQWINANNYKNAKENGWIPSYPAGANEQGPEPEPWEYVWVGRDLLT